MIIGKLLKDSFEIYLVEWSDVTGGVLVVTKNKITSLINPDKFYTLQDIIMENICNDSENRRVGQLSINCDWLISQFDMLHDILCPGKYGTWQSRVQQVVDKIKEDYGNNK